MNQRKLNRYNLKHGYSSGDRLLKEVAELLTANIRDIDWAARFGGDVFALLLIDASAEDARTAADRIQSTVRQRFSDPLDLFIGLAGYPKDAFSRSELLNLAREALNQAKVRGGDGIYFLTPAFSGQRGDFHHPAGGRRPAQPEVAGSLSEFPAP